jgi:uncharacterized tellurite resistance protein B-like protein
MTDAATRRNFEALVAAAFVDGILATPERELLRRKASRMSISHREMNEILALGEQRKLSVSVPPTKTERESLLDDLIDVVTADGRIEAPEYHLLARFAETLKISLPELRARVNRRMPGTSDAPRRETVRTSPRPAPPPPRPPGTGPSTPSPPAPVLEAPKFAAAALPAMLPMAPSPSFSAEPSFPRHPNVADLPPVTLQLLRQSVMFDSESDSILYISRTLSLTSSDATEIRQKILAAFPDLKPGSQQTCPAKK